MNIIERHPIAMKNLRHTIKSLGQSTKLTAEQLKCSGFSFEAAHYLVTGYLPRKWTT